MSETGAPAERKKVWYLHHLDLFADLSRAEIDELAALLHDHHVPAGVDLLGSRQHEQVFIVKEGVVRLDVGSGRQRVTAALLGPGRLFGLSGTVGEAATAVAATTLVPSYVCVATWAKLLEVLVRHPPVLLRMMRSLAEHVFRIETWRARLRTIPPRARLAQLLIELADEFGQATADGQRIPFRLERADLARMIGASRETASRVMAEFERAGWVDREAGCIVVRDSAELAAQAGKGSAGSDGHTSFSGGT